MQSLLPKSLFLLYSLSIVVHAGPPDIGTVAAKNPKEPIAAVTVPEPKATWTVGAGALWRQMGEVQFHGGRRANASHLPAGINRRSGAGHPNGYVLPDSSGTSQTWNWGYDSPSQISGNYLMLDAYSSSLNSRTSVSKYNTDWSEDLESAGFYLSLESPTLFQSNKLTLSASLGYSFTEDEVSQNSLAFRAIRSNVLRTYHGRDFYDVSALSPLPSAPNQGTFNGPGPIIDVNPVQRSGGVKESIAGTEIFTSHLQQSLEVQLHTLSLGPRAGVELGNVRLLAGLGFALNIAPWDAESVETLTSSRSGVLRKWHDSSSGTEILPGAYAELSAEWNFAKQWLLSAGARYDWSESLKGEVGNASFDVDLGGWTAMLGLGFRF